MNEGWSRAQRVVIEIVSAGVAGALWLVGDKTIGNTALIVLSVGAAAVVVWLSPSKPVAAFGVLFLMATLSRGVVQTSVGNMRLEQPAIVAGWAALLLMPSRVDLGRLRHLWPIGVSFAVYLGCLTLSSVLFAPDKGDSLRMSFWTGLSMSGGLLALLLLARGTTRAIDWVCLSGYVQAIGGILFAVLFFTLGPVLLAGATPAPGVQEALTSLPKVFSLSQEANLYASFLATLTVFGLHRLLSGGRLADKVLVPLMAVAIAFGVTRGAYLGLAAGLAVYLLATVAPWASWAQHDVRGVGIRVATLASALAVGVVVAPILMQGGRPPTQPLDITQPGFRSSPVAVASGQPSGTPAYKVVPPPDTLTFRLERVPQALADLPRSPLVGLGANTFGQRHLDPTNPGQPDHIAILALAALYEAGVLGAAGLAIGFGLVLLSLLRATRRRPDRGRIAAYAGALVCLLVAYQATNALNFALIWLLAGAGLAESLGPSTHEGLSALSRN